MVPVCNESCCSSLHHFYIYLSFCRYGSQTGLAIWINEDVSLTVYNSSPRTTTHKPSLSFKTLGRLLWWSKYRSTQRKPPGCSAEKDKPRCHPDQTGPLWPVALPCLFSMFCCYFICSLYPNTRLHWNVYSTRGVKYRKILLLFVCWITFVLSKSDSY